MILTLTTVAELTRESPTYTHDRHVCRDDPALTSQCFRKMFIHNFYIFSFECSHQPFFYLGLLEGMKASLFLLGIVIWWSVVHRSLFRPCYRRQPYVTLSLLSTANANALPATSGNRGTECYRQSVNTNASLACTRPICLPCLREILGLFSQPTWRLI